LWRPPILKCVFTEIIKINHKTIKRVIIYEIFVTVEVTKSKTDNRHFEKKTRAVAHVFMCTFFKCAENR